MPKGVYVRQPQAPRQYPPEMVERCRTLYGDGKTQAEIAGELGVTQKVIWRLMKHHGLTARVAAKRNQRGERNDTWKGDSASYTAGHVRVKTQRGQPSACEVCGTTGPEKTYDWANLTGRYHDPSDYRRLCRSCHWKCDGTIRNLGGYARPPGKEVRDAR